MNGSVFMEEENDDEDDASEERDVEEGKLGKSDGREGGKGGAGGWCVVWIVSSSCPWPTPSWPECRCCCNGC